jgi:PAS domain S-box-containing protein
MGFVRPPKNSSFKNLFEKLLILTPMARRRHMEVGLRESEGMFKKAFQASPQPMAITTLNDGRFIDVNGTFEDMSGYAREEIIGYTSTELKTWESPEARTEFINLLEERGSVHNMETRFRTKAGAIRVLLASAEKIELGGQRCLLFALNDITERKRAEEQVSLLQTIVIDVGAAKDLSSALEVVVRRVCEKTGWVLGQAWIPSPDGTVLECSRAWSCGDAGQENFRIVSQRFTFERGIGLPGRVWSSQQPVWVRDVTLDANFPRAEIAREAGLKAALGIPIISGDEVIAVLEFFLSEPRPEDETLVKVIAAVTVQLNLVIERKQAEENLLESHARIKDLAGRLIVAQEEERKHIARELHDDLNQQVAALAIGLGQIERYLPDPDSPIHHQISKLQERTAQLTARIRRISHQLHSSTLEHVGLAEALRSYCAEIAEQEGIIVDLEIRDGVGTVPPLVGLCLYRIAQESLRNVAKHSGSKTARVMLASDGATIEMHVADQGVGFEMQQSNSRHGLGLVSMEERVRLLNGCFELKSRPGAGTELKVQIPLRRG